MKYHNTETEVRLGDRVIYKHLLWGQSEGEVAYLPGVSATNDRILPNQWVVRLQNGKGVFMVFGPDIEFAHKRIKFLRRDAPAQPITADEEI
jgi:hypothetical protein